MSTHLLNTESKSAFVSLVQAFYNMKLLSEEKQRSLLSLCLIKSYLYKPNDIFVLNTRRC